MAVRTAPAINAAARNRRQAGRPPVFISTRRGNTHSQCFQPVFGAPQTHNGADYRRGGIWRSHPAARVIYATGATRLTNWLHSRPLLQRRETDCMQQSHSRSPHSSTCTYTLFGWPYRLGLWCVMTPSLLPLLR